MGVVVITGAGGGMGLACVRALRDQHQLLLVDIDADRLGVAAELAPGSATDQGNVADAADVERIRDVVADAGGLAGLVHLAGISPNMASAAEILEVDLAGTARLVDALVQLAEPGAAAVCIASIAAHMPFTDAVDPELDRPLDPDLFARLEAALGAPIDPGTAYVLSKRGVVRLCEREAQRWGRRGARIASISPGLIDTPMGRLELRDNPGKAALIGMTPGVPRDDGGSAELPGRVEDIADGVAFLCSSAAWFVNGCDLRIDGGITAVLRHRDTDAG
jgi:NAD(P)-dependent dehydrogenase (short-subunit alcohol dehydrogenase family)